MQQRPRRGRRRLLQGLDPRRCDYSQTLRDTSLCERCRCRAPSHFVHSGPSRCGFSHPRGTTCHRSYRAVVTVAIMDSTGSNTSGGDGGGTGDDATRLVPAQSQGQSRPGSASPHDEGEPASSRASGSGDFLAISLVRTLQHQLYNVLRVLLTKERCGTHSRMETRPGRHARRRTTFGTSETAIELTRGATSWCGAAFVHLDGSARVTFCATASRAMHGAISTMSPALQPRRRSSVAATKTRRSGRPRVLGRSSLHLED